MPSQHSNPRITFRPAQEELDSAAEVFEAHGILPGTFLRACLRWLASEPDAALAALAAHWPDRRPLGRPRKKSGSGTKDGDESE